MNEQKLELRNFFSTSDLALATVISLWYPLDAIDKSQNSQKAYFVFKRDEQLDQLIENYWRGELRVNPQEYFNALKNLKARLYENR